MGRIINEVNTRPGVCPPCCEGSPICESWVVTATHCNVFSHPDYYQNSIHNTIALVKLVKPADISQRVSPVTRPKARENVPEGTLCAMTGMASTNRKDIRNSDTLQQAFLPLLSSAECGTHWQRQITDDMVSAGAQGATPGRGDSGGPLVCKKNGVWKLVGILSNGSINGHNNLPVVCPCVTALLPWIRDIMTKN
ncbi:PREDICTED: chymotrypsinogen B-like [Condylura cristata]|uniref:chymotrypsinogen B-like n=1 Tax=Condylura cristata TaxID=143302 RepID=UPI0003346EA8|nr:PREDICTED: chymotrypsinogen B-like [Condylura cristata]